MASDDDDILQDLFSWSERSRLTNGDDSGHSKSIATTSSQPQGLSASSVPINVASGTANTFETKKAERAMLPESTAAAASSEGLVLPAALQERLFPYQCDGVRWLYQKHRKARACLLADEMGLGKTVQVCALLGLLYGSVAHGEGEGCRERVGQTIIVMPATLLSVWVTALARWANLRTPLVEVIHGESKARRRARWQRLRHGLPCVLLTSYGVLRQDAQEMAAVLVDYVILDEAQLIKDASTCTFKAALGLSARHKIALTGTPLMNSFEDLWSLFRFMDGAILAVERGDFGRINQRLLHGNERDASESQRAQAAQELRRLQAAIAPFMLRREKKDVAAALQRGRQDLVVWVGLSAVQRGQYEAFLESKEVLACAAAMEQSRGQSLLLLTTLQQLCNHPWLGLTEGAFDAAVATPFAAPCPEMGDIFAGSKLAVCLALLRRNLGEGRKALVFARSRRLLRLLGVLLTHDAIAYCEINGDSSPAGRAAVVREFHTRPALRVCLLTTQVGGVGLTLAAASCVVLLDPSWSPSVDAQAVDRCHRIGQERDVHIYRLITCGTVEEKVYRNQIFKTMAARQTATMTDATPRTPPFHRYFTRLQLRSMFELGALTRSETAAQLTRLQHAGGGMGGEKGAELEAVRRALCDIEGVCDVSDHGAVFSDDHSNSDDEDDDDAAAAAPDASPQTHSQGGEKDNGGRGSRSYNVSDYAVDGEAVRIEEEEEEDVVLGLREGSAAPLGKRRRVSLAREAGDGIVRLTFPTQRHSSNDNKIDESESRGARDETHTSDAMAEAEWLLRDLASDAIADLNAACGATHAVAKADSVAARKSDHEAAIRLSAGVESRRSQSFEECLEDMD